MEFDIVRTIQSSSSLKSVDAARMSTSTQSGWATLSPSRLILSRFKLKIVPLRTLYAGAGAGTLLGILGNSPNIASKSVPSIVSS